MLNNSNILLFVPGGEGIYGTEIKKKLEQNGAYVKIYNERPSSSFLNKAFIRLFKQYSYILIDIYIKKIIEKNVNIQFNWVLIIRGEAFHPSTIRILRKSYPNAKFILYLWDSINNTDTRNIIPFFDKAFSYDPFDVSNNSLLIYQPTFYLDQYRDIPNVKLYEVDSIFIGTIHSDRFDVLNQIKLQLSYQCLSYYYYMYFPHRILYYRKYIIDSEFRNTSLHEFHFSMLCLEKTIAKILIARSSLDITHPVQTGLTLRPIEMLGAKKKLITTNHNIKYYDFYDQQNILIIDRKKPVIDKDFIYSPYNDIDLHIYNKYSLQSWVNTIFS